MLNNMNDIGKRGERSDVIKSNFNPFLCLDGRH